MALPIFRGAIPALVTPFSGGAVDEDAFARLVERQIVAGVGGVVPCGTTGETSTLSHDEHRRVVELCVRITRGRVPVIAGAGSNSTAEAIELTRHAKTIGAHAALIVAPYYNKPSQEGLYLHYKAIADAVEIPILTYNVPSRTVVDISNETLGRLSKHPNIVGIKDATGDHGRADWQANNCGPDWVLLSGNDDTGLAYMAHGGQGCISVTCNVAPDQVVALYAAALAGDFAEARRINRTLARLHKALFADSSPAPAKWAMSQLGLCADECRLPIAPCAEAIRPELLAAMGEAGLRP